jgi:Tol biopolymer transport system component
MSPEQVRGRDADPRSDIFAFGAILYEMLAGRRAFGGETIMDTMSGILKEDPPDLTTTERHIAPALARIVDRCMEKNPAARFQSMRDLAFALEGVSSQTVVAAPAITERRRSYALWVSWVLTTAAVIAAVAFALPYFRAAPADAISARLSVNTPPGLELSQSARQVVAAVSPDGHYVVFVAGSNGGLLWIRALDEIEPRPLAGTETPALPFWSPDSHTIGFFSAGKLKTIGVDGGSVQSLCDATNPLGGTWNREGVIVFAQSLGGLWKVAATGGQPEPVTAVDAARRQTSHRHPSFLPDGRRFLFVGVPSNTIWLGSLDSKETTQIVSADSQAQYAPPGYLLFTRQNTLLAQRFDDRSATLSGDAVPVAEHVTRDATGYSAFSVSANGTLVYRTGAPATRTQLTWFDRKGQPLGVLGQPGFYRNPTLAPDGTRVALELVDLLGRNEDIWIMDVARGVLSRFTFDPHNDIYPVWSADGRRIVFGSDRDGGVFNIYQKSANGAGDDERVMKSTDDMAPYSWSPDGRFLLYRLNTLNTGILSLTGERKAQPLLQASFTQSQPQISPDGRWVSYVSAESGTLETYVRSFPAATGKWQVSQGGAVFVRWRGNGKELYYYAPDFRLMAVPFDGGGAAPRIGAPVGLFESRMLNGPNLVTGIKAQYDATRDGQRFLINVPLEEAVPSPITVLLNWSATLKK